MTNVGKENSVNKHIEIPRVYLNLENFQTIFWHTRYAYFVTYLPILPSSHICIQRHNFFKSTLYYYGRSKRFV